MKPVREVHGPIVISINVNVPALTPCLISFANETVLQLSENVSEYEYIHRAVT
jgi:energy-converting hydrogenase Eha subunit E